MSGVSWFLASLLLVLRPLVMVSAFVTEILPGTGLTSKSTKCLEEILIFEHTAVGTGGLVLNRPTPIRLKDLSIPNFQIFGSNALMLGKGIQNQDDGTSNIGVGEMSPWFWIHNIEGIHGSYLLEGAAGPLFMGGNIEEAAVRVEEERLDTTKHFKFFYKYKQWGPGELEREIDRGCWEVSAQDCDRALIPYCMSF